ncbi:MAG: homoserine kinase [Burkholderiaceae bacterium]
MAVYTPVPPARLERWLQGYDLGRLADLRGIETGIENTNYFVDTERGRYVLTLFERLSAAELPYYLGLMRHLAARGIPCPDPVADRAGALSAFLEGKPAALVTRLAGASVDDPTPAQCARVGALLAAMHLAGADYDGGHANPRGAAWRRACAAELRPVMDDAQRELADDELALEREVADAVCTLPAGAVHADLFRDNVLFDGERVGGVVDFYFAGRDAWLFDLAVVCNDWCIEQASGAFDPPRLAALVGAYAGARPFVAGERELWGPMLRAAALRFWLSRLADRHGPRPAQIVHPKDPSHFERILRLRRAHAPALA